VSNWQIEALQNHVIKLTLEYDSSLDTRRICILSDIHWDNAHCRLDILADVLDKAKKDNIPVCIFGDFFCAMQGRWDKRADQDQLRDEHRGNNYLDKLVDTATQWFEPYKDVLALVTLGNHETKIHQHHQTNLIDRFSSNLRQKGSPLIYGPYWGFMLIRSKSSRTKKYWDCRKLHWHHGFGGGGEVGRGISDHAKTRSQFDADIYVSGHIHRRNFDENIITTITAHGHIVKKQQLFIRCSTFKDEAKCTWHSEMGRGARPIGGWWLDFEMQKNIKSEKWYRFKQITPIMT
jgi:UDP-2,3-diacylglucosamine pyrophosphatase LpxH